MAEAAVRGGRRGPSWKRLWTKLRDAVRRPKITTIAPSKSTAQEPMADPQPQSAALDTTTHAAPPHSPDRVAASQPSRLSFTTIDPTSLTVDESIGADDSAEPFNPMLSTRTSLSKERAQLLFEKYGIKLEPRITGREGDPAHDICRVEKPIRVRVHYTCEDCGTNFGSNRICSQCGHHRCRQCHRNPARRVREVLAEARQEQRARRQEQAQQASVGQQQPVDDPIAARVFDPTSSALSPDTTQPVATELEGAMPADETDSSQYQYVVQHRARAGVQWLLRPWTQLVRRICHECQTHFEPANQAECQTCSHSRCKLCPYETAETATRETQVDEQRQPAPTPIMMATVQRVYKKPRQRVRWTCDRCDALFTDRERCQECGHRKCDDCIRDPPRRIPRPPDPEIEQAVEDKISIPGEPSSSSYPAADAAAI